MNEDIRVDTGLFENLKVRKFLQKGGSIESLLRFWCWTAKYRPDGVLSGIKTIEEISLLVESTPEVAQLLLDLRFIDHADSVFVVHQWRENQPWASAAQLRSDLARFSAIKKVDSGLFELLVKQGYESVSKCEYETLRSTPQSERSAVAKRLLSERSANAQRSQTNGTAPSPALFSSSDTDTNSESEKLRVRSPAVSALPAFKSKLSFKRINEFYEHFLEEAHRRKANEEQVTRIRLLPESHLQFLSTVVELWNEVQHVLPFSYKFDSAEFQITFAEARVCYGDKAILEMVEKVRGSEFLPIADTKMTLVRALGAEFDAIHGGARYKILDLPHKTPRELQHQRFVAETHRR